MFEEERENEIITEVNDGLSIIENKNGLTFGTDALMLASFMRSEPTSDAAEIGSGSGIISLLLSKRKKLAHIKAYEVQEYYAELTGRNAERNRLTDRITPICADVRDVEDVKVKTVFSNPPYMEEGNGKKNIYDCKYAARHEVFGGINELCQSAGNMLLYGGRFYVVYRPDRLCELLSAMKNADIAPKRICFVHQDTLHAPCLVLIEGKKSGKPRCDVTKPLFLCKDGSNEPTEDANYIYKHGEWPI